MLGFEVFHRSTPKKHSCPIRFGRHGGKGSIGKGWAEKGGRKRVGVDVGVGITEQYFGAPALQAFAEYDHDCAGRAPSAQVVSCGDANGMF